VPGPAPQIQKQDNNGNGGGPAAEETKQKGGIRIAPPGTVSVKPPEFNWNFEPKSIHQVVQEQIQAFDKAVESGQMDEARKMVPKLVDHASSAPFDLDFSRKIAASLLKGGFDAEAYQVLEYYRLAARGNIDRNYAEIIKVLENAYAEASTQNNLAKAYKMLLKAYEYAQKMPGYDRMSGDQLKQRLLKKLLIYLAKLFQDELDKTVAALAKPGPDGLLKLQRFIQLIEKAKVDYDKYKGTTFANATAIPNAPPSPGTPSNKATYTDAFDDSQKMQIQKLTYTQDAENYFGELTRSLNSMLEVRMAQANTLKAYHDQKASITAFENTYKRKPNVANINDRRLLYPIMYNALVSGGKSRKEALDIIMGLIRQYLVAYNVHSVHDVPDAHPAPVTGVFSRTLSGEALKDCGIFAMQTAYELSSIRTLANIDFYFVALPQHVALGIVDPAQAFGWALQNDSIFNLDGTVIKKEGIGNAVARTYVGLPTPQNAQKLTNFTEKGLRNAFLTLPDAFNGAPQDVRKEFFRLKKNLKENERQLSNSMAQIEKNLSKGNNMNAYEKQRNQDLILFRFSEYVQLTNDVEDIIKTFSGASINHSSHVGKYFIDAWKLAKYGHHILGMDEAMFNKMGKNAPKWFNQSINNKHPKGYVGQSPPWQ